MKFKKGDEVIVVRNRHNVKAVEYVNHIFTISFFTTNNLIALPRDPSIGNIGAYVEDIELKSVYESPLYKALS